MKILIEYDTHRLHITKDTTYKKKIIFDNDIDSADIILLHDDRFSYFWCDYHSAVEEFTIHDRNSIFSTQLSGIKEKYKREGKLTFSYMDEIFIDGVSQSPYGKTGEMSACCHHIFLKKSSQLFVHERFGSHARKSTILPRSFFTTLFVKSIFGRNNFELLSIFDTTTQLVCVEQGGITAIHSLNLGTNDIKKFLEGGNLKDAYFQSFQKDFYLNPIAHEYFDSVVGFFGDTINRWLADKSPHMTIFISALNSNEHMLSIILNKISSTFLLPFKDSDKLKKFLSLPDDKIDVHCLLNYLGTIA